MRKIDQLFTEYAESHQNPKNKLIHWICVPLIFFSIVGFISIIPTSTTTKKLSQYSEWSIVHWNFGYLFLSFVSILAILFLTIFYSRLSKIIGIIMFFIILLMFY